VTGSSSFIELAKEGCHLDRRRPLCHLDRGLQSEWRDLLSLPTAQNPGAINRYRFAEPLVISTETVPFDRAPSVISTEDFSPSGETCCLCENQTWIRDGKRKPK
jgi:hypothetical protein